MMAKVADKESVTAVSAIPVTAPPAPPTPAPPPPPPPFAGLSPEHLRQLTEARQRATKIRRAISVAKFDGWSVGMFGALTFLVGAISFSWIGLLLGGGMLAVAWVEFRGADRLRRLDAGATKSLAFNQLVLGGLLLTYAIYSLWGVYHTHDPAFDELRGMGNVPGIGDIDNIAHLIGLLIYGTLAAVAIFGQGGTALYYHTRRRHIESYLRDTPPWIVEAQRAGMPLL